MFQLTHTIRKRLSNQIRIEIIANNNSVIKQVIGKFDFNLDWGTQGFYRGDYMINDDSRKRSFNYLIENDLIFLYNKTEAGSYTVSKDKRQNYHIYYTQLTLKSLLEVI